MGLLHWGVFHLGGQAPFLVVALMPRRFDRAVPVRAGFVVVDHQPLMNT